ncbi:hypothetical protein KY289_013427 [Solanum tuberosum]|nr:hypothetical protein KY289_013427 [Solanum tuberosum]
MFGLVSGKDSWKGLNFDKVRIGEGKSKADKFTICYTYNGEGIGEVGFGDLYYGLFMHNKNSVEELERLELAFDALKKKLFGHLHDLMRSHLFGKQNRGET